MSNDFLEYLNIYEFETILPGSKKKVRFKPLTTNQLKKLLIYENEEDPEKLEEAFDVLIASSVLDENFNIDEIYLQDRIFFLFEIRKKTKGQKYKFTYKCPKCDSQSLRTIDLDKLKVDEYPKELDDIVKLDDNLKVRLRFLTRGEQKTVYKHLKEKYPQLETETEIVTQSTIVSDANSIISIITPKGEDTDVTLDQKVYFIENIPTPLYEKIKNWFEDNSFGINFSIKIKCSNSECKTTREIVVPFDNFFFG